MSNFVIEAAGTVVGFLLLTASVLVYSRVFRRVFGRGGNVDVARFGALEFGFAAGLVALYGIMASGGAAREGELALSVEALVTGGVFQVGLCALLGGVLFLRGHSFLEVLGVGKVSYHQIVAWSALLLAAFYPLLDLAVRVQMAIQGKPMEPQPIVNFARELCQPEEQLTMVLFAVVIAPLTEEFVFRGFLYRAMKSRLGALVAALMTSLLFSFIHLHGPSFVPLALFGFVLVLAYERTGSLLAPMLMHSVFNALNLVLMRVAPDLIK